MRLNQEVRESQTRNRTATITPINPFRDMNRRRYNVSLEERGKRIKRTFDERVANITTARRVAREWCA